MSSTSATARSQRPFNPSTPCRGASAYRAAKQLKEPYVRRLINRLPLGLSALALAISLTGIGGAAYAAGLINGNTIKAHTIGVQKLTLGAQKTLKGARGPAGPAGPAGSNGLNGNGGANGANGVNGVTSVGPQGQTGPAGAGVTPLTFGPYAFTALDHNQVCSGSQWATDTGNVTYTIVPTVGGLFDVTELREGTFVVNSGDLAPISTFPLDATINSPGGTGGCGFLGSRVSAGVTGRFYGERVYLAFSGAFDFTATCAASCAASAFFNSVFGVPTPPPVGSDQFHYRSVNGNAWNWNAISGPPNSGDILQ